MRECKRLVLALLLLGFLQQPLVKAIYYGRISYSSFYGGPNTDAAYAALSVENGAVYFAGTHDEIIDTNGTIIQYGEVLLRHWDAEGFVYNPINDTIGPVFRHTAYAMVSAPDGGVWLSGQTRNADFPMIPNGHPARSYEGNGDAFVALVEHDGTLQFSIMLGGSEEDVVLASARTPDGGVWLGGGTTSTTDFPLQGTSYQDTHKGQVDGFLARLSDSGALVYSTYLGGSKGDVVHGMEADGVDGVFVCGETSSVDFVTASSQTQGPFQTIHGGDVDTFFLHSDSSGHIVYSSFLGGLGADVAQAIAASADGQFFWMVGSTSSANFPVTIHAQQTRLAGSFDAFVAKWSKDGYEKATCLFATADGGAWIGGQTNSTDFPYIAPPYNQTLGGLDAFIARIDSTGFVRYSTYLGGALDDSAESVQSAGGNAVWVAGWTQGQWPNTTTVGAAQPTFGGVTDSFLIRIDSTGHSSLVDAFVTPSVGVARPGAVITVTVTAALNEVGLRKLNAFVNDVEVTNTFVDLGNGSYTYTYVPEASNTDWNASDLAINIAMQDYVGEQLSILETQPNMLVGSMHTKPALTPNVEIIPVPNGNDSTNITNITMILSAVNQEVGWKVGSVAEIDNVNVSSNFLALPGGQYSFFLPVAPNKQINTRQMSYDLRLQDYAGNEVRASFSVPSPDHEVALLLEIALPVGSAVLLSGLMFFVWFYILSHQQRNAVRVTLGLKESPSVSVSKRRGGFSRWHKPLSVRIPDLDGGSEAASEFMAYTPRLDTRSLTPRAIMEALTPKGTLNDSYYHFHRLYEDPSHAENSETPASVPLSDAMHILREEFEMKAAQLSPTSSISTATYAQSPIGSRASALSTFRTQSTQFSMQVSAPATYSSHVMRVHTGHSTAGLQPPPTHLISPGQDQPWSRPTYQYPPNPYYAHDDGSSTPNTARTQPEV
eukprot:jgi/Chlat1/628/Chrsp103S00963